MHSEDKKQALPSKKAPDQLPKGQKKPHPFSKILMIILGWVRRSPILSICTLSLIGAIVFRCGIAPAIGRTAGTAVGSWRGVTQGIAAGAEAGKAAGLSAEDTEVKVGTKMTETGSLQVMLVDLNLTDIYQQGNAYAALYSIRGEGVFSVDLTQAEVSCNIEDNKIMITVPEPEADYYPDDSTLDIVTDSQGRKAEYIHPLFNGSTVDGYAGYLNSGRQLKQKAQEEMQSMLESAENSARRQVEQLVKSVCGNSFSVDVGFVEAER